MNGGEILIKVSDTYEMRGEDSRGEERRLEENGGGQGGTDTHYDPVSCFLLDSFHLNQAAGRNREPAVPSCGRSCEKYCRQHISVCA